MHALARERGTDFAFKEQVLARIALDDAQALARRTGRAADPTVRQEVAHGRIDASSDLIGTADVMWSGTVTLMSQP